MKGSRKNLKILFSVFGDPVVWTCYWYYERQLKYTFFQLGSDQTTGSRQKIFFKAKILIEVSKQLQKFVYRIEEEAFYFIL